MSLRTKNNTLIISWIILCLTVIGIIASRNAISPDGYLHLGIGRYVISRLAIPSHADISYKEAAPSLEWISHSWLFDTLAYLSVWPSASIGALILLVPFAFGNLWLVGQFGTQYRIHPSIQILALTLTTLLMLTFWKVHPLIIMGPMILCITGIFDVWRRGRNLPLIWLPLIALSAANLSGGYLLIIACILALYTIWHTAGATLSSIITGDPALHFKGSRLALGSALIVSALTSLISPFGFRLYLYGITGYALLGNAKWYSSLAGALEVTNTSIFKTNLSPAYYLLFMVYFLLCAFLIGWLLIRNQKSFFVHVFSLLPTLCIFWFGFFFIRFIPFVVVSTMPLFAVSLQQLFKYRQLRLGPILAVCMLCLTAWVFFTPRELRFLPPTEQCDFLKRYQIPPNILVSTEITGYLYSCLFPQKQQIDARDDFFDGNDTIGLYGQIATITEEQIKVLLEDNDINVVLTSKDNDYITTYFNKKPGWSLYYIDYNGMLFIKDTQLLPDIISQHSLKYVDLTRNLGVRPDAIASATAELATFSNKYPQNTLAIGQLASLYRFGGKLDQAKVTLHQIPVSKRGFVFNTEMGRIAAAQGKCAQSESYFLAALRDRGEQNVTKTVLDVAILYAGCFEDMPKAKKYFQRYLSFPLPEFEKERAKELVQKFGITLTESAQ